MRPRILAISLVAVLCFGGVFAKPAGAGGRVPSGAVHWIFSGWGSEADRAWDPGFGFALTGGLPLGRTLDLRFDWGARWLDGDDHATGIGRGGPRWGGLAGTHPSGLRIMPATVEFVYRLERWSQGRFWVPYVGVGPGLYDMRASFRRFPASPTETPDEIAAAEHHHNLFRFGWHARAGARLHRTSGLFLDLGTAAHFVDVPGEWSPLWEASLGVGTFFHGSTR